MKTRTRSVLVIDDSPIAADKIARLLERAGFDVEQQDTPIGVTARLLKKEFDAVVIDLIMPAMRGDRLAALICSHWSLERVPVVLTSASEELPDVSILSMKNVCFVPKDALDAELVGTLERALDGGPA